jgi:hypothetical protein
MKYIVIGLLWVASIHYLMGDAYMDGFQQGYVEGKASVTQTEQQVFLQCTEWWFNGSESRAKQAINQYCDRRIK